MYLISDNTMHVLWKVFTWSYSILFIILFLVSISGRYLKFRRWYVHIVLKILEYTGNKIAHKERKKITEDTQDLMDDSMEVISSFTNNEQIGGYKLDDICSLLTSGIASVVEDSVTPQFTSEKLPYWNLLSRNNAKSYELVSPKLTLFWIIGFFIRYCLFLPIRITILLLGMIIFFICTFLVGCLPNGTIKKKMNAFVTVSCFDIVAGSLSLVATFHDKENMPKSGIAVANHTSPIDSLILATDNCYDMVGQRHGGLLGYFMHVLSRSSSHIWFDRGTTKDRLRVTKLLKDHAADEELPPILIFPEGVCVNNTSVMQFRKGVFEINSEIYPIAVRFDARFGDAFWWQDYFTSYVLCMMTSWAIVCDIWYLPPMKRLSSESSVEFASRVKAVIADKGGMVDNEWDGLWYRVKMKTDMKDQQQKSFSDYLVSGRQNTPTKELQESDEISELSDSGDSILEISSESPSDNGGDSILEKSDEPMSENGDQTVRQRQSVNS